MFESKTARPNIVHLVSFLVKTDKIFRVANEVSQLSQVSAAAVFCVRMREIVMDGAGLAEDQDARHNVSIVASVTLHPAPARQLCPRSIIIFITAPVWEEARSHALLVLAGIRVPIKNNFISHDWRRDTKHGLASCHLHHNTPICEPRIDIRYLCGIALLCDRDHNCHSSEYCHYRGIFSQTYLDS